MRVIQKLVQLILHLVLFLSAATAYGDTLQVEVTGLDRARLTENVRAHVGGEWVSSSTLTSERRRDRFRAQAESRAARALRPFGYYSPRIKSTVGRIDSQSWLLTLEIDPGEAVTVRDLLLEIKGPGSLQEELVAWRALWPLQTGARLNQPVWEEQKQAVLVIAEEQGYLSAAFEQSEISLDLDENVADLVLVLSTGPRAVMGTINYKQDIVRDHVLASLPRFDQGDYYSTWLVERLRNDLWMTGYFDEIDVVELRHLDQDPQRVDFEVTLKERKKSTHQTTIGYGTDSEFRTQYRWQRHLLSRRGDSIGVGLGWQQRNDEWLLSGEYRIPRYTRSIQHWLLGAALKTEVQEVRVSSADPEEGGQLVSGRTEEISVRLGKAKLRNISRSREQLTETMYVQFLFDSTDYDEFATIDEPRSGLRDRFTEGEEVTDSNISISLGMEWDWPVIQGKGFETSGHHEKAWLFTANEAWGSEREFTQIYLGSRWNFVVSDHWKILIRGEAGYSDAKVYEFEYETEDNVLGVSVTELPYQYRFKAGGSRSVRGYGFEELSTNNIGSNHLFTASAELEYQFRQDWSLAAFYDIGNAFNDWSKADLKTGMGVGLRWYTLAGAIRFDVAQAQDISGKPWQLHLTIGTPLL